MNCDNCGLWLIYPYFIGTPETWGDINNKLGLVWAVPESDFIQENQATVPSGNPNLE